MPLLDNSYETGHCGSDPTGLDGCGLDKGSGGGEASNSGKLDGSNGSSYDWGCGFSRGEGSGEVDTHGSIDGSGSGEGSGYGSGWLDGSGKG
jgi:hypothetical protein